MDECKSLLSGDMQLSFGDPAAGAVSATVTGRGLNSSTFQLNSSASCRIWGA